MDKAKTALEMIEQSVLDKPDKIAVIGEPEERITYAELWELSGRIYAWLKERGIGAEDAVMYCLPRGIGLYACILGTMRAGAAFVLTETENDTERTNYIQKDCACKVFVDETCWEQIIATEARAGYEPVNPHNLCYIAYTSGTTGNPKGVLHEYGSLENAWMAARIDGVSIFRETDVFLLMSPMNFVSTPITFSYMAANSITIALMPYSYKHSAERFTEYVRKSGANCGYLTPSFLRKCHSADFSWRMCILSSEPADGLYIPETICYNCYASTESGCLLGIFQLPKAMTPAPVGRSQSDIELFLLRADGTPALPGEAGEVCYRNPYVRGYLNNPKRTKHLLQDGIFHTGDRGRMNCDGDLILCGRMDEMIKIGGYRIESEEIADAVRSVSGLQHFVVRGFVYKDISSIIVFYTDDVTVNAIRLQEELLKYIPEYMIPTNYIKLREFPLLDTGKTDKQSLLPPEGSWEKLDLRMPDELTPIESGRTASVYDWDEGRVLKIFKSCISYADIYQEMVQTQEARLVGIPVPRVYEIVRWDGHYGLIMDKVGGKVLEKALKDNPEECDALIERFADAVRKMHRTVVAREPLLDVRQKSIELCERLDPVLFSSRQRKIIRAVLEAVPEADTFVHGDCHTGNAILDGDTITFIDLMVCGKGHPVFDLLCMYSHYVYLPSCVSEEECFTKLGVSIEEAEIIYEKFLKAYYPGISEEKLLHLKEWIKGVHAARFVLVAVVMPGVFPEEILKEAANRAVLFYEAEKLLYE